MWLVFFECDVPVVSFDELAYEVQSHSAVTYFAGIEESFFWFGDSRSVVRDPCLNRVGSLFDGYGDFWGVGVVMPDGIIEKIFENGNQQVVCLNGYVSRNRCLKLGGWKQLLYLFYLTFYRL